MRKLNTAEDVIKFLKEHPDYVKNAHDPMDHYLIDQTVLYNPGDWKKSYCNGKTPDDPEFEEEEYEWCNFSESIGWSDGWALEESIDDCGIWYVDQRECFERND